MKIEVYKTGEISQEDWQDIVSGFNESFQRETTQKNLTKHYTANTYGYALHAIARGDDGRVCGHTTVIPYEYQVGGEQVVLGLSGGTYVREKYRSDIFIFRDMYFALKKFCREQEVLAIIGVPNKNSFRYTTKILKKKFLFDLEYYVLPVNIGNMLNKSWLSKLNFCYTIPMSLLLLFNHIRAMLVNKSEVESKITITRTEDFMRVRFSDRYHHFKSKVFSGYYRIFEEGPMKVAYIMDYREGDKKTFKSLNKLVSHIIRTTSVDAVMYVGTIKFKQSILFRLPKRFQPQRFPLTITETHHRSNDFSNLINEPANWEFSLMNYDVR